MIRRIKHIVRVVKEKVTDFVVGTFRHAETVGILSLSAVGLNALAGELPFLYALPMWIELPLVIPVLSVMTIVALVRIAEYRSSNRMVLT